MSNGWQPGSGGGGGAPSGPAGGDLAGTYPNPSVGAGKVTVAKTASSVTLDAIAAAHATGADVSLASHKLTNVTDPSGAQDAATKNYVDAVALGLTFKAPADLGTIAALPTNLYVNGASGVGATLTATAFGALSVDGTAVTVGQRILIKNEAAPANNGIYVVTVAGGVATLYVLTRAADYNQASEIQAGDAVFVTAGGTLADTLWIQTTTGAIVVGTSPVVFSQLSGGGSQTVQTVTVPVTSAQIKALFTTPVVLVPGVVGSVIVPLGIGMTYVFGTTPYTLANPVSSLTVYTDVEFWEYASFPAAGLIDQSQTLSTVAGADDTQQSPASDVDGAALILQATAGDPTIGDGDLLVTVAYFLAPTA